MPLIHRMGPSVELELKRPGFLPAGGGRFHARVEPVRKLSRLDLPERGSIRSRQAGIWTSKLPEHVAERELAVVREELKWRPEEYAVETVPHPMGPGNAVVLAIEGEHVTEVFTGFGERGRPAEEVARSAAESIAPAFDKDPCNPAFASDLSRFIVESEARLWVHGHIHCPCDYTLGKTRVLANPRGYPTESRQGFDPGLVVDV